MNNLELGMLSISPFVWFIVSIILVTFMKEDNPYKVFDTSVLGGACITLALWGIYLIFK